MKVFKFAASFLRVFAQCPLWGIALLVSPAISGVPQLQPSKQPKFCIDYNSSDQDIYAGSMAVSDRYIVFGNAKTNQVTIYQRDDRERWLKFRTITPPADSPFARIGSGFGTTVAFDQDTLIIAASVNTASNPSAKRELLQQIYKTSISNVDKLLRIDHPALQEITGGNLAIQNGRIAFGTYQSSLPSPPDTSIGVLSSRGLQVIKNPVIGDASFGEAIALRDNLLGSPF
jgi:hypothetical protein